MPIDDERLQLHKLGYYEIKDKPSIDELSEYYAHKYYQQEHGNYKKKYSEEEISWLELKIAQKYYLIEQAGLGSLTGSMLDVGCGEGYVLKWFLDKGYSVEGLDFSLAGVNAMNPEIADHVHTGDVFTMLNNRITSNARYDVIWLQHVLEHVIDPLELMKLLGSLLTENGALLITVPNDGSNLQESLYKSGAISERFWIAPPDHLNYFGTASLANIVKAAGWQCVDIIGDFPIDLYLLHRASNYVQDRQQGKYAHLAQIQMDLLIAKEGHKAATDYYRAGASVGIGRSLTALVKA